MPDQTENEPPAQPAADSDRSPASNDCRLCQGTGTMSWQQPCPDGTMRTMEWPCPNGCGGHWKHPAAQSGRVIEQTPDDLPATGARAAANEIGGDFIAQALENWGIEHPALRDRR